ncbi:MAG: hypothetical protein KatS3mg106_287 [Gemmataceae bacterium]|nr:MAG: hypothetical protein KatS3mg106_287 [Gemmataceae bacterium]
MALCRFLPAAATIGGATEAGRWREKWLHDIAVIRRAEQQLQELYRDRVRRVQRLMDVDHFAGKLAGGSQPSDPAPGPSPLPWRKLCQVRSWSQTCLRERERQLPGLFPITLRVWCSGVKSGSAGSSGCKPCVTWRMLAA